MFLELIILVVAGLAIALLVLPFITFVRVHRLSKEFDVLAQRVEALEQGGGMAAASAYAPASAAVESQGEVGGRAPEGLSQAVREAVPRAPSPTPAALPPPETLDFEGQVGGRWLLYVGVFILLLGVSFFLKYAFDSEWIGPWGRVLLGFAAGVALVLGGLSLDRRGLAAFGRALAGTGLAMLYLSVYAALTFYGLIDRATAFAAMVAITATGAWLADRAGAQSLAILGVGGGFLTPFLVGGDQDASITLFTYDALLVLGTLLLARRHRWPALNALSYVLTVATLALWADEHYTDVEWRRTLFFLTLFCALFLAVLRETHRVPGPAARLASTLLWSTPGLYHLFALIITSEHPPAFHVYIIVFTLTGLIWTAFPSRPWLRVLVLLAALVPLFGYMPLPEGPSWLAANLVTICAVCGLHLMVLVERVSRRNEALTLADLLALHLTGLGLFGLLQQTLQTPFPALGGSVAMAIAALAGVLWLVFQPRDRLAALNAAALGFTLLALAVALQFDGRVVVIGWAAEGVAITWLGLRVPSRAFIAAGLTLWGAAVVRLADGYFVTPAAFSAIVNERSLATLSVIALGYGALWAVTRATPALPLATAVRKTLHVACSILSLLWVSAELHSYWELRYDVPQAYLYEQLLLSLGWGLYGASAVTWGMLRGYAPLRYIGIIVIGITVLKVFFVDLWDLGGIYRVIGFLTLGVLLVLVSYLYHTRHRETPTE
ncbi:MAG: DUF2339 domain-containing protein [Acidobacteria bacterium]|nr:DUF2339 domain-containing protein [Acidobacteriota bacterium]